MDESDTPTPGTPLTTPGDYSRGDSARHDGVDDGQPSPMSATVGHSSASVADNVGQSDIVEESDTPLYLGQPIRKPEHVLGSQVVCEQLVAAMFPRSQRSVERYCQSGKLDAFFDPITRTYWITQESVDVFIDELRRDELARNPAPDTKTDVGDDVRHRPPASATVGHDGATMTDDDGHSSHGDQTDASNSSDQEVQELKATLKRKEQEIIDLKITNRAKDEYISRTGTQFEEFLDRLADTTKRVGELETENRLLKELPAGRATDEGERVFRDVIRGD